MQRESHQADPCHSKVQDRQQLDKDEPRVKDDAREHKGEAKEKIGARVRHDCAHGPQESWYFRKTSNKEDVLNAREEDDADDAEVGWVVQPRLQEAHVLEVSEEADEEVQAQEDREHDQQVVGGPVRRAEEKRVALDGVHAEVKHARDAEPPR